MALYQPPASINDFKRRPSHADAMRQEWHATVVNFIANTKDPSEGTPSELFYDQLNDESGIPNSPPVGIPWSAFPQILTKWFATQNPPKQEELANRFVEKDLKQPVFGLFTKNAAGGFDPLPIRYRRQDEYCEWFVARENGHIRRIYFTCEPPEYWEFMAQQDLTLVHELYKELLHDNSIPIDDLRWSHDVYKRGRNGPVIAYPRGHYNRWNVWNTEKGAVHLTHWANTLGAEVQLASDGSLGWPVQPEAGGGVDKYKLICCAGFGGVNRSSDPKIGGSVFDLARQGQSVALADPIGLYMQPFALPGLRDPEGNPIGDQCLKIVRQSPDGTRILRAEVATPTGATYGFEQCTLDGKPLLYGGQISRTITMSLYGVTKIIPGKSATKVQACPSTCCRYPGNPEFSGIFATENFPGCDRLKPADWSRQLRDVADAGPHVAADVARHIAEFVAEVEALSATHVGIFKPRGRRLADERNI